MIWGCKVAGISCGSNPQTCSWTPEVRGAIRLKKEAYWAFWPAFSPVNMLELNLIFVVVFPDGFLKTFATVIYFSDNSVSAR